MKHVLLTHADSVLGRRMVKTLCRDPEVAVVLAVGDGPEPSWIGAYPERVRYQKADLARARHLIRFVSSERWARAQIDSVVHLPVSGRSRGAIPGHIPGLVSETRRLLSTCREQPRVRRFVYVSSAFVYQPEPANGCVIDEESELRSDVHDDEQLRAWIDADLACQAELNDPELCVSVLRAACIATVSGDFLNAPPLHGPAPLGYDPLVSVVSERDLARAVVLALHADRPGAYNVAGSEVFARSRLVRDQANLGPLRLPASFQGAWALAEEWLGRRAVDDLHRYGIVLSTRRAAERLGYAPRDRLELRRAGGGPRLDAVPTS